jgi:NAD(P)-dependent dehydrogenase (short-subunit alcohol dehydrogenase family)
VSVPEQVEAMVRATVDQCGGIDVLVNNAAIFTPEVRSGDTDVVALDLEAWERSINVNLRGPLLCCRYTIPEMQRRSGGSIVNIGSMASEVGNLTGCSYGASKGGLKSLTRYIAAAFGKDNIRANTIGPGVIMTPGLRAIYSPETLEAFLKLYMLPRFGEPEDIAALVVFLASDASSFITAQFIMAEGGMFNHLPTIAETLRANNQAKREPRAK